MKLLWSLFLITVFCSCRVSAASAAADSPGAVMPTDDIATRVLACTGCHGKEGRAASDGFYPRIAGKPAGYLYNQLLNFRDGRRRYPVMSYLVQHLSNPYLQEIADHFAAQHPSHLAPAPAPAPIRVSAAVLERGRVLVRQGDTAKQVPACVACHGAELGGVAPAVPGLLGLSREYLSSQFGAWRNGVRHASAPDCMALVAQRLALEDVEAVSAWLSAQVVPPMLRPATHSEKFPLPCGSAGAAQ